jgi:acyl-CoA synthetase (AMP-forming)/AMP-acid ligase II
VGSIDITDRLKELIKVKGFQFAPSEAEATLLDCPLVSDVAVVGVYDENEATEWPRAYGTLPLTSLRPHILTHHSSLPFHTTLSRRSSSLITSQLPSIHSRVIGRR